MISGFRLEGFKADEEAMIYASIVALQGVGHDTGPIKFLVRADDMPATFRGMCLSDGVALGTEAFRSQAVLNHVLEEELLHLQQKAGGSMEEFGPMTAVELEKEVNEQRKFRLPKE